MRKRVIISCVTLVALVTAARAEQGQLGATLSLEYRSKWLSKGAEAYKQQGAFFKTLDLDFYGTGLGLKVTHRNATASGYVDKQRFDYRPYYKGTLFEDSSYATNFNISAGYEHYPGLGREKANTTWEWIFAFSWPKLLPQGLTPSYIAHYEYPAGSNYRYGYINGWVHRFRLTYDLDSPELAQPLRLISEVAYTDGLGGASSDWSYAVFGISTDLKLNDRTVFVPGVYQQISMEDSVAKRKDITYCILTLNYKF